MAARPRTAKGTHTQPMTENTVAGTLHPIDNDPLDRYCEKRSKPRGKKAEAATPRMLAFISKLSWQKVQMRCGHFYERTDEHFDRLPEEAAEVMVRLRRHELIERRLDGSIVLSEKGWEVLDEYKQPKAVK